MKLLLLLLVFPNFQVKAEIIERILAIVNDEIVTQTDVVDFKGRLSRGALVDDLLVENPKSLLENNDLILKYLIDERVLDSEIKKQKLEVTMERVEDEIKQIANRNQRSVDELRNELKRMGTVYSEYQYFIKQRLERQALIEKAVTSKVKISDEEVSAYYLSNKKGNTKPNFEYRLSHIMVLKGTDPSVAKEKITSVKSQIKRGSSFETLASKFSEDPNFQEGGFLGVFNSGEFLPDLENGVINLDVGQTSEVIETKTGFHILKLLGKKLVSDPEFVKNKERIREFLYQAAFKKQFSFWLEQQRKTAYIKVNP